MAVRARRKTKLSSRTGSPRREPQCAFTRLGAVQSVESPQCHLAADQQASAILGSWLVNWLGDSVLGLWTKVAELGLSRLGSTPQARFLLLVLQAALWLLLVWLLSDLHLGLPCFLLALLYWICEGPIKRVVRQARARWTEKGLYPD